MDGKELSQISARRFYVLLKGLPADSLFLYLYKKTPRTVTTLAEIESITALAGGTE